MRKSTLSRFNSDQGAENYKKKFDRKLTEQAKNHSEQRLIEQKIADLPKTTDGHCVLDMPSGVGRFYPVLKRHFPRVLQADWSGPMLQVAQENLAPNAAGYLRMSALELPFRDKQFPLVFSVRLCHHLPTAEERRRYLQEILRVSHGWVVVSFLDTFSPHNLHRSFSRWLQGKPLKWHISGEEVADIAESQGFAVVSSSLLSRLFSGQRYAVLLRASQASECSEARNAKQEAADSSVSKADDVKASEPLELAAGKPRPTITERIFRHIHVWRDAVIGLLLAICLFLSSVPL